MKDEDRLILLDMDGVLVDANAQHLRRLNSVFGTNYTHEDLIRFNYYDYLPHEHAEYVVEVLWQDRELYNGLSMIEGARHGILALQELARVVVVSAPMWGHASSKLKWLLDQGFEKKNIILTADKTLVERMSPDGLLIDDGPHFLQEHRGPKIIVDRPWNRYLDDSELGNAVRVESWDEIAPYAMMLMTE